MNAMDFGDELTLDAHTIPWLIWIQLLVLLLLFAFLFFFTIYPSHDSSTSTTASSSTTRCVFDEIQRFQKPLAIHDSTPTVVTNRRHSTLGGENLSIKGEIGPSTSTGMVREEITEGEESSLYYLHPCHYFQLARVAFLKCLGLDSASDSPSTQKHRKRKES